MLNSAYLCGMLCSGGSLIYNENKSIYSIEFKFGDYEHASFFLLKIKEATKNVKVYHYAKRKSTWVIRINDKRFVKKILSKFGTIPKKNAWNVPKEAYENNDFRINFLKGLFDRGAYIRIRIRRCENGMKKVRNIRINSSNLDGLNSLKRILKDMNIKSNIYPVGDYFCMDLEGKNNLENFKRKIGFSLADKQEKLNAALKSLSELDIVHE